MKLCYYLSAIGQNNLNVKLKILHNNCKILRPQIETLDIIVNCYSDDAQIKKEIEMMQFDTIYFYYEQDGVLMQMNKKNPYNSQLINYDYILFILDDIYIKNFDVNYAISIKKQFNLNIISPSIINATHKHIMNDLSHDLYISNHIEIFMLLFDTRSFLRFLDVNKEWNRWLWGIDYMLGFFGFRCGILNTKNDVIHIYHNNQNNLSDARFEEERLVKYYNFIKEDNPIIQKILF